MLTGGYRVLAHRPHGVPALVVDAANPRRFRHRRESRHPASSTTAGVWATCWAELEHRIGYSHLVNRFDPTKVHADPRSVARRDEVYAPQGVTGESIRVIGA
jgi:hypothetical protein